MILKAVTLFLIFMLVLGMFGKLRLPSKPKILSKILPAQKCSNCGAFTPKGSKCPCGSKRDGA